MISPIPEPPPLPFVVSFQFEILKLLTRLFVWLASKNPNQVSNERISRYFVYLLRAHAKIRQELDARTGENPPPNTGGQIREHRVDLMWKLAELRPKVASQNHINIRPMGPLPDNVFKHLNLLCDELAKNADCEADYYESRFYPNGNELDVYMLVNVKGAKRLTPHVPLATALISGSLRDHRIRCSRVNMFLFDNKFRDRIPVR